MVKITKSASSIDRSSPVFERLSLVVSIFIFSSRCCCCSFRPRRDKPRKTHVLFDACFHFDFETRDRVSEICFSLLTNISPLSLSLSLEQHSMLHRRRVRRGPDHGHDRAEVPAHRGKQRASLKVVFARFIIIIHFLQHALGSKMSPCSTHHRAPAAPFFRRARRNRRRGKSETNDWSRWWSFVAVFRREWGAHSLSLSFARM